MSDENGNSVPAPESNSDSNELLDSGNVVADGNDDISADDLQELANDPSLSKEEKKEVKKMLRQLEIKYNGKSEKIDLPFEIPEEHADYMRRQLQMSKMSQSKAQEAAAYERDISAFIHDLQTFLGLV